ncbi:glycosyltransferase family 1 protein [Emticicia sp. BO119]|uniref:glycosyltransferase family 4 protein n=1 Tax=Emticicia sp. BO119 TaxID=2757768 RepID=UPI0015EFE4AE|nr:glycosyltransferase family 1 protein [Emticicia sp. BO119]MBA4849127.1 glycosyltransferase family 4 protein [Emticicia sp. BO119]
MSKIVLDSSVLGLGFFHEQSRTGVYRVAENLLKGLSESNTTELSLASTEHLPETLAYLEKFYPNISLPVVNKPEDLRLATFENNIVSAFTYRSLPQKIIREVFTRLRRRFKPFYQFDTASLSTYNIYHSPFLPIPQELKGASKPKKVITIHDLIPHLFPEYFGAWNINMMKKILESIDTDTYPVCVSEATKNDLCEVTGISPDRVFVAHLAASEDKFYQVRDNEEIERILKKYNINIHKRYLLSIATLEPRKNIERTIRSFLKLIQQEKIDDLNLVLVGTKGWDFETIFDEIKANPLLKEKIVVTGFVADEDLAALYSAALAFVYPSLYEGFGLPPLEAMQCGTPVITSNKSAMPEVVEDAGFLVEPTDENAIADAMLKLYTNKNLRIALSKKAILQAQKFCWKKFTEQHIQIYQQIS